MSDLWFDLYRVLRFATRLPLPSLAREEADPVVSADRFAPAFAVSGLVVGLIGWLVGALLFWLGASATMAAIVCVGSMVWVTGALHEDGLADCADGMGGGRTRERKLEIMRDPRIGTYGVLALVLSVGARVAVLSVLFSAGPWIAFGAIMASQSLSRGFAMLISSQLDQARPDGAAARLGRPSLLAAALALLVGTAFGGAALVATQSIADGLVALLSLFVVGLLVSILVTKSARSLLGGQTGDVLGANQQAADLAGLFALSISIGIPA